MSAYNRYSFTKEVYPNYIVLLVKKNKYYSYSIDRKVLDYIKFKDKTYILRKKHINYPVLDELDIVEKYKYFIWPVKFNYYTSNSVEARQYYIYYYNKLIVK